MKTNKITAMVIIALITSVMIAFPIPNAQATPQNRIILPFHTSWEDSIHDAKGRTNAVDWKTSDFYGYNGPDDPLQPELGWRNNEVAPPEVFGFDFGSRQLMAAGHFGSSYSYCYFSLFDTTAECDCGPPIKLRSQTFINLWYYHHSLADCMIDAEIFNKETRQFSTLRGFNYNGKYVVDQNGVRIHPACRCNDPIGSWEFASFDLSIIYESDPENWYITKIWIAFDNDPSIGDGATGQARTYFDMLFISYAISDSKTKPIGVQYANFTASIIPYDWYGPDYYGKYHLYLKAAASAYLSYSYCLSPYQLSVSVDNQVAVVMSDPEPTGINVTDLDSVEGKVTEWLTDCGWVFIKKASGGLLSVIELAAKFCKIFGTPAQEPTYEWPKAVTWGRGDSVQQTYGEACIELTSLGEENSISITFNNEFRYYDEETTRWWHWFDMSLPFVFEWSTEPDELPVSLSISTNVSPEIIQNGGFETGTIDYWEWGEYGGLECCVDGGYTGNHGFRIKRDIDTGEPMYGRILQDPNADFSDSGVEATVFVTSPLGSGSNWEAGMGVHFNYAGGVQIYMGLDETNNKAKARILHRGNVMATAERSGISAGWYWIELSFTYQESSDTVSFYVTRVGQYPEEGPILFGEINLGDLGIGAGDTVTRMVVFMKADSGNPLSKFDDVSLKVFNTDPAPGTYTYDYGSSVTVTAIPDDGYVFYYWILDGATVYDNPINVTMNSDHDLEAYFAEPVCAMKTLTDGGFYVPNATSLLKIEKLFDDSGIEGDQTGGSSPYETISDYPDKIVELMDFFLLSEAFEAKEGDANWNYMADINADGIVELKDYFVLSAHFGNTGTYITDLSEVTVTFNTGEVLEPENGYVTIPSGAASFTVKQDGTRIGAMIIFW